MGYFSWCSCVSGRSLPINSDAVLLLPDDTVIAGEYNGYGEIDNVDVYILYKTGWNVEEARRLTDDYNANGPDVTKAAQMRDETIKIDYAYNSSDGGGCGFKFMLPGEYKPGMKYKDLPTSFNCPWQGVHYSGNRRRHEKFEKGHGPMPTGSAREQLEALREEAERKSRL